MGPCFTSGRRAVSGRCAATTSATNMVCTGNGTVSRNTHSRATRPPWTQGVPVARGVSNSMSSQLVLPRSPSLFVTSNIVGPLLVAVGVGLVGYLGLLWFNAATFLAPIAVWLMGIHPPAKERGRDDGEPGRRPNLGRDILPSPGACSRSSGTPASTAPVRPPAMCRAAPWRSA